MNAHVDKEITLAIAKEQRAPAQIGSDLEFARVTRGIRWLLAGVSALVALLVLLSLVIKVDEVARARGEFVPVGRVQVIQTTEGGAVDAVLVQNGDHVDKGQLIARFRAPDLVREIAQTEVRIAYLQIQMERIDAFVSSRDPNFEPFREQYATMVQDAVALLGEQKRQLQRSLDQRSEQIEEEQAALDGARTQIPAAARAVQESAELLARLQQGVTQGVISQNRVAEAQQQLGVYQQSLADLNARINQHRARVQSLMSEREAFLAQATGDARSQRGELSVQLDEMRAALQSYNSRSADTEVRAPIAGIVQKISETPVGTVVAAGGTVCEIVPTDGGVLMQARVTPRDIGFVRIDQKVIVKSDAFDYGRFGSIEGRVRRIAPSSTIGGPDQPPYFQVEVELASPYVGDDKTHIVTAGMTGEATILTGEKTIFQYLLKPIYTTLDTALSER